MTKSWINLDLMAIVGAVFLARILLLCLMRYWHQYLVTRRALIYTDSAIPVKQRIHEERTFYPGLLFDSVVFYVFALTGVLVFGPVYWQGALVVLACHVGIVEPVYYLAHRFFHSPLGMRIHGAHHYSIATQPETAFSFSIAERVLYAGLFTPPLFIASQLGVLSFEIAAGYILLIDFLNIWGHFNVDTLPKWWIKSPLRYFIYSPRSHGVHHRNGTQNYALFMPIWDYLFGSASANE
jgi:aldehyde decarbonylase